MTIYCLYTFGMDFVRGTGKFTQQNIYWSSVKATASQMCACMGIDENCFFSPQSEPIITRMTFCKCDSLWVPQNKNIQQITKQFLHSFGYSFTLKIDFVDLLVFFHNNNPIDVFFFKYCLRFFQNQWVFCFIFFLNIKHKWFDLIFDQHQKTYTKII